MTINLVRRFSRQFAYDAWANREVLTAIRASRASSARGLQLLSHILSAEQLWLERVQGKTQSQAVWPELSLEQCEKWTGGVARLWSEYLDTLTPDDLARAVTYKNSQGESWTSTVEDIVTHVLMHSAYHRGQIATFMRANGDTPAYTDFIHAVRQGMIPEEE